MFSDGGGDSWSRGGAGAGAYGGGGGGGGRRGPAPAAAPPRKRLEITEELTDQLVALKGGDKDYWLLNSALAKLVDKNLTQIIDALVGVPIVDYISNVWATSLVITVLSHSGQVRVMPCGVVSCHMCGCAWADQPRRMPRRRRSTRRC